jgi:BASS family bile acid:Na+ symporter
MIYVIIGLNHDTLFNEYTLLVPVSIIAFMRTFFPSTLVFKVGRMFNVPYDRLVTYTLFGSYKNLGLTATTALILFGVKATVPSAVCILFETMMFVYYSILMKDERGIRFNS